jgi:hypothetical protein
MKDNDLSPICMKYVHVSFIWMEDYHVSSVRMKHDHVSSVWMKDQPITVHADYTNIFSSGIVN